MIIGITGKAGSGKDTVADFLCVERGYSKYSWAAPIKAALAAMGFPEPTDRDLKEAVIPGLGVSWRHLAQTLGTEWGRKQVHPDLWVMLAAHRMTERTVVADVRFENEAAMIREKGGFILHLVGRQADLGGHAGHESESGVQYARGSDAVIDNSYPFDITKTQVLHAIEVRR